MKIGALVLSNHTSLHISVLYLTGSLLIVDWIQMWTAANGHCSDGSTERRATISRAQWDGASIILEVEDNELSVEVHV